jgi:hypothetical protein
MRATYITFPIAICLFCFVNLDSLGQALIKGKVTDESSVPIEGAKVEVLYLPIQTETDKNGNFILTGVPYGEIELKVRKLGYAFITLKVNIDSKANGITIKLLKQELPALPPLLKELNQYREKVIVVTDKPYYYPGEIIWLKAFMNYYDQTKRDSLSRVVYVELLRNDSYVVTRHTLSLDSGRFAGSILLSDELKPGNYILRAYTRFMNNFGEDQFFYKSIPVLDLAASVPASAAVSDLQQTMNCTILTDQSSYGLRSPVNVELEFTDKEDSTLGGNFSVSVTDVKQVVPVRESTLLTAWGYDANIDKVPPIDVSNNVELGVRFVGRFLTEFNTGKQVTLSIHRENLMETLEFITDEKGWFQVNGLKFYDSITYFYKAKRGKKGNKYFGRIEIEQEKELSDTLIIPGIWFTTEMTQLPQRAALAEYLAPPDVRMLDAVEVREVRQEAPRFQGIQGGADKVVKAETLTNMGNLLLSLQGRIPGLFINCSTYPCTLRFQRTFGTSLSNGGEPLILVNDAPMAGAAGVTLQNIDITIIDRIEVSQRLNPLYGDQGRNGIIAVYLKDGFNRYTDIRNENLSFELKGFNRPMKFVNPNYTDANQEGSMSDYRSTLYWNPELQQDNTRNYGFNFFTSDMPGRYRIVIQGVTSKGQPVYAEKYLDVKE